jgi:hypothetical protein
MFIYNNNVPPMYCQYMEGMGPCSCVRVFVGSYTWYKYSIYICPSLLRNNVDTVNMYQCFVRRLIVVIFRVFVGSYTCSYKYSIYICPSLLRNNVDTVNMYPCFVRRLIVVIVRMYLWRGLRNVFCVSGFCACYVGLYVHYWQLYIQK